MQVEECEAPRTRYFTKPWIPRNLRRRYERCSRKQQKLKHSFTRKSSATLSVLFTQPTKQSVVSVMTCRHVGCFRFLETEKLQKQKKPFGQKLQLMQHPNVTTCQKTLKSKLRHHVYIQTKRNVSKASHLFTKLMKLPVGKTFPFKRFVLH